MLDTIVAFLFILIFFYAVYALFAHIGDMARRRGHSPWPWWIISVLWSPFGSIAILWLFFEIKPSDGWRQLR
ncbi:hypothetical protein [Thalassovita mediterranea]|jgi:hypothetical protein|uniref:hypothetical protein n=1 Tax=Thalassovita mediterranea TaxID=340021 RepID=UPI00071C6D71|nr:hypothetical protein [Thalassovita mediterranea]